MPLRIAHPLSTYNPMRTVTHQSVVRRCVPLLSVLLLIAPAGASPAEPGNKQVQQPEPNTPNAVQVQCLPEDAAFLRARLNGSIDAELSWNGQQLSCAGSVRPNNGGIRLRFAAPGNNGAPTLVLLFGISGLKEGASGKALPVNVTIMREGTGEFFGTQGDNKCTIDEIHQEPLQGIPLRQRAYRITARGFCTQPARALNGEGSVLITRFDFAGRADFVSETDPADNPADHI